MGFRVTPSLTDQLIAEGEQRVGSADAENYYYTRDDLGSIREVTDATGTLQLQYDYDAWGNSVVIKGKMQVNFGYTSHYFHQPSGLNLAMYRAYSPTLGRWISRDPLENAELPQGPNVYAYVSNIPTRYTDPFGLDGWASDLYTQMGGQGDLADFVRNDVNQQTAELAGVAGQTVGLGLSLAGGPEERGSLAAARKCSRIGKQFGKGFPTNVVPVASCNRTILLPGNICHRLQIRTGIKSAWKLRCGFRAGLRPGASATRGEQLAGLGTNCGILYRRHFWVAIERLRD
jgi:RHS repeat-associated protein